MASVYWDPAVGGDGTTLTDADMANYGHVANFIPALSKMITIAQSVVTTAGASATSATAAAASASSALNAPGTNATSTSSVAIATGSKSFTIQTGKAYVVGQTLNIASAADPANFMAGQVTAYNSGTGALTVNVTQTGGSGTKSDWVISMGAIVSSTLPSQTGNNGKFLTTNGTSASWGDVLVPSGNLSGLANYTTARANLSLTPGTHVQAYDAGLQSIAGLTTAADKMIYTTALDTYAVTDLTANGRSLIGAANYAAMRALLDLEAGTDFNAYSAKVAAFSALTGAADKLAYFTGASTMAVTDLSSFARTILDDVNAGAVRGTIGAAASGANTDITSLGGLSTPIPVTGGGTGVADLASLLAALPVTGAASGEGQIGTLKFKWGSATVTPATSGTTGEASVAFTNAFPTACAGVFATVDLSSTGGAVGSTNYAVYVRSPSASGCFIGLDSNGTPHTASTVYWLAIGY